MLSSFEAELARVISGSAEGCGELSEIMAYAVGSGGKRIRPMMALGAALACSGSVKGAMPAACAVELVHNYTLIHDDLPSMDGDEFRRGAPSVWKKYGEALAILAGDALQALAFRCISSLGVNAAAATAELAARAVGVVVGQTHDIARAQSRTAEEIEFIYARKTADLFIAAAKTGALSAGASEAEVEAAGRFAEKFGMAFQFADDLSDGDSPYDREKTLAAIRENAAGAIGCLGIFTGDTSCLMAMTKEYFSPFVQL